MPIIERFSILIYLGWGAALLLAIWPAYYSSRTPEPVVQTDDVSDGYVVGIEFGQDYARIAIYRNGTFEAITDEQNRSAIPSYVAFGEHKEPYVGFEAKEQAASDPKGTIYGFRNLMGLNFGDFVVQNAVNKLPYDIWDQGGKPAIVIHPHGENIAWRPEDISGFLLTKLKDMAESQLTSTVSDAVITVPSYFNHAQREAMKRAARAAGLNPLRMVDESAAVGIAHRLDVIRSEKGSGDKRLYVVVDVREGQSEVTLLKTEWGVFEIVGMMRDSDLRLGNVEASISSSNVDTTLTTLDVWQSKRVVQLVEQVLARANVTEQNFDGILLSGDFPASAKVQNTLESNFPGKTMIPSAEFTQDQAVVYGAAWQGCVVQGAFGFGSLLDVTLLSLGIELNTGAFLRVIPRQTVIPTRRSVMVSIAPNGKEKQIIRVFEGQREIADRNGLRGTLDITPLLDMRNGESEIEVAFEVNGKEGLMVEVRWKGAEFSEGLRWWLRVWAGRDLDKIIEGNIRDEEKFREEDFKELEYSKILVEDGVDVVPSTVELSEL